MLPKLKNVIAPIQQWLLSNGACVGCGKLLVKASRKAMANEEEKVICKCGRIYIFSAKTKKYRRGLTEDI